MFNVLPIVCGCSVYVSLFCYALFLSILKKKRKGAALFLLSYRCVAAINVLWLFLTVP